MDPIKPLLESAGWKGTFRLEDLPRLGNNRVFKVLGESRPLLLKSYFHDPEDPRDRLKNEFSFVRFAWEEGLRTVPQPLAQDAANHMAVYEFMEGSPLSAKDLTKQDISEAAQFFLDINTLKNTPKAQALGPASESVFSIQDQLDSVRNRLKKLESIDEKASDFHAQGKDFVQKKLKPAWKEVEAFVIKEAASAGLSLSAKIDQSQQCLSPSDFGFHNSLRTPKGTLRFFDFEYAGWDDPAKTVSDFYHQPRFRIAPALMPAFVEPVLSFFSGAPQLKIKIALARPVFGMKWSCIMLNDFLPLGDRKRKFAMGEEGGEKRLSDRLQNAQAQLKRVFPLNLDLSLWS